MDISRYVGTVEDLAVNPAFVSYNGIYIAGVDLHGSPTVFVFPNSPGSPVPAVTISGPATLLTTSMSLAVRGNIYVEGSSSAFPGREVFLAFSNSATGNAVPTYAFTGASTDSSGTGKGLAVQ